MAPDERTGSHGSISAADPITREAIDALVSGTHGAPFDLLGPHHLESPATATSRPNQIRADTAHSRREEVEVATSKGSAPQLRATLVRTFIPGAHAMWVVPLPDPAIQLEDTPRDTTAEMLQMRQLHPAGLFSVVNALDFTQIP